MMSKQPSEIAVLEKKITKSRIATAKIYRRYRTKIEAMALHFAKREVMRFHRAGNPWSNDSPFSSQAGHAFWRRMMRNASLYSDRLRMEVIALARHGVADARKVLHDLIGERNLRGEPLPPDLVAYDQEVRAGGIGHAPEQRGEQFVKRFVRDLVIACIIAGILRNFPSIKPTGRSSQQRSACAIVAEALLSIHVLLSAKDVERIWNKYKDEAAWVNLDGSREIKASPSYFLPRND